MRGMPGDAVGPGEGKYTVPMDLPDRLRAAVDSLGGRRWRTLVLTLGMLGAVGCGKPAAVSEVRVAYDHQVVTLDPHGHDDAVTRSVLAAIYEPLVCLSPDLELLPCLASTWTTPSPNVWHFTIRRGVRFHDGRPLGADDVLFSLNRARRSPSSAVATYLGSVSSVRIAGDQPNVVEIRTTAPAPLLLSRLAMVPIVPADYDPGTPVGTGPYRLGSMKDERELVLERWEKYWGRSATFEHIHVLAIPDGPGLERAVSGREVDVVANVSARFLLRNPPSKEWHVARVPALATTMLAFNVRQWPASESRVREAVDLAIDRTRLVQEAFPDHDALPAITLIPVEVFGFSEVGKVPPPDPDRARELLRSAGVAPGTELLIQIAALPDTVQRSLRTSLEWIGLGVRFEMLPWKDLYTRIVEGRAASYILGWNFPLADAMDFFDSMVHSRDPEHHYGLQNGSGYSNPQVDRWIERAALEVGASRRLELIRRIHERVARDRPYIPLYHRQRLSLVRKPFSIAHRVGSWVLPQEIGLEGGERSGGRN